MVYHGTIKNGIVAPENAFPWPDGTKVTVDVSVHGDNKATKSQIGTLYDRLKPLIGKAEGLPSDLAENHDYYLHGRPKK